MWSNPLCSTRRLGNTFIISLFFINFLASFNRFCGLLIIYIHSRHFTIRNTNLINSNQYNEPTRCVVQDSDSQSIPGRTGPPPLTRASTPNETMRLLACSNSYHETGYLHHPWRHSRSSLRKFPVLGFPFPRDDFPFQSSSFSP